VGWVAGLVLFFCKIKLIGKEVNENSLKGEGPSGGGGGDGHKKKRRRERGRKIGNSLGQEVALKH